jgi:hypothetical protein
VEERVAAVTNMVTAFRAGDIPTFLTYYTEDAVYKYEGTPTIPWAGSFHVSLLIDQAERHDLENGRSYLALAESLRNASNCTGSKVYFVFCRTELGIESGQKHEHFEPSNGIQAMQ